MYVDGYCLVVWLQNYGILFLQVGIKGYEDFGGGWCVLFKFEQGFNFNDGIVIVFGYVFFCGVYVGFVGLVGIVMFGCQFSVLFDKMLFYDLFWYGLYSGQGVFVLMYVNFIDYLVKYQLLMFVGFDVEVFVVIFGVVGNMCVGCVFEFGGQYMSNGLLVSVVLYQVYGEVLVVDDVFVWCCEFGMFVVCYVFVMLLFIVYVGVECLIGDFDVVCMIVWGGVCYLVLNGIGLNVGVYYIDLCMLVIGYLMLFIVSIIYVLLKCIVVYVNFGYVCNSGQSLQIVYEYDLILFVGVLQFGVMVGMYYLF